jgi:hypothetical protein
LFSIGTITLSKETVLLLSVGVSKIISIEEFDPQQGTLDQITIEVVPSTMELEDFCARPKVSMEDKVYP